MARSTPVFFFMGERLSTKWKLVDVCYTCNGEHFLNYDKFGPQKSVRPKILTIAVKTLSGWCNKYWRTLAAKKETKFIFSKNNTKYLPR